MGMALDEVRGYLTRCLDKYPKTFDGFRGRRPIAEWKNKIPTRRTGGESPVLLP